MIRLRGTVTYKNGRAPDSFEGGAPILAKWEIYALRHGYPVAPDEAPKFLWMLVVAHAALGVSEGFDTWIEGVDNIEDFEGAGIPPTPPAPSSA